MSIFDKLKLIGRAKTNDILNRVIDMNSIPVLNQYVEDLQAESDSLSNSAADQAGTVRTLTRKRDEITTQVQANGAAITKLKAATPPDQARLNKLATAIVQLRQQLPAAEKALADAQETSKNLDIAKDKLRQRVSEISARIETLRTMDTSSKAKDHAAQLLQHSAKIISNGPGLDGINSMEDKIRAHDDQSTERLNRTLESFNDSIPDNGDTTSVNDVLNEF